MRHNLFKIALSLVLVLGLMPGLAFAEPSSGIQSKTHPGEGSLTTSSAQEHPVKANSGKWGECDWEYDTTTKTLTVHPGQAGEKDDAPWRQFLAGNTGIKIIFKEENGLKVELPTFSGGLFSSSYPNAIEYIDLTGADASNVENLNQMFISCQSLKTILFSDFDISKVKSTEKMFDSCASLTSLDLSGFKTSSLEDMSYMFNECTSLTSLNLSGFDTSNVTNMDSVFLECNALTDLDISSFNTSNVEKMPYLFSGCSSLTSIDISHFITSKVVDFTGMFSSCSSLTSIDISNLDTSMAENLSGLFAVCSSLTSIDFSKLNTSKVTDMSIMFGLCTGLTSLDLSSFNTENVTNMSGMFIGCSALVSIDFSNFNTEKVTNMEGIFSGCAELKSLDLSTFNTAQLTDKDDMFSGCDKLDRVTLGAQIQNLAELPSVEINGHTDWFSFEKQEWVYSEEIAANRLGIADTYTKYHTASLDNVTISNIVDQTFTGESIIQSPLIVDGEYTLIENIDYKLSYKNNINAGTATVTIDGLYSYIGSESRTFTIKPKNLQNVTITLSQTEFVADGGIHVPTITSVSDPNLVEGTDYDVKYSNASSKEPGTYSVWIEGKGNYAGASVKSNYTIISSQPPVPPTPEAPSVVVQPKRNIKVKAGSTKSITLSFKAQSSDGGALSYQWFKNNKPIKGATKPTYTVSNPALLAPGNYSFYCMASEVVNGVTVSVRSEVSTLSIQSPLTLMKMTSKGKNALVMKWNKATNADGYDIFFAQCNHGTTTSKWKLIKTINKASTTTYTKTKLKANSAYKSYVRPFKLVNGKKIYLAKSPQVHAYTNNGSKTYTNPKALSLNKTKVSIKNKKSFQLKSKVTLVNPKKKGIITGHAPIVRYVSSNASIAKVTKTGKITGVSKGTCTIYAFTQNGITKACKVTVS